MNDNDEGIALQKLWFNNEVIRQCGRKRENCENKTNEDGLFRGRKKFKLKLIIANTKRVVTCSTISVVTNGFKDSNYPIMFIFFSL